MALAGITVVTVNPAYRQDELRYIVSQSRADGIFLLEEYRGYSMAGALDSARPHLPELRHVWLFSKWERFIAGGVADATLPGVTPDDMAQIQHTSGTTGFLKGAELHHRRTNVLIRGFEPGLALELAESERATLLGAVPTMLVAVPDYPSFGARDLSSLRAVIGGGSPVFTGTGPARGIRARRAVFDCARAD